MMERRRRTGAGASRGGREVAFVMGTTSSVGPTYVRTYVLDVSLPSVLVLGCRMCQSQTTAFAYVLAARHHIQLAMKTDRIRTNIIDIIFIFIFLVRFGFEYG